MDERPVVVRLARPQDGEPVSALMHALSHHFLAEPGGPDAARFFTDTSPDRMREHIAASHRRFHVAEIGGGFAGFVSLRDDAHISQFFVAPAFHGQGIGRLLWQAARAAALEAGASGAFSVDSSLYAVPVYERFGFAVSGPWQEQQGLVFIPMSLSAGLEQPGL